VDGTDGDMLWNGSEEDENVRCECEGDKGTVKMETVTLIGTDGQKLTRFLYEIEYSFSEHTFYFWWGKLRFG
jgi:hypothetical protein